MASALTVLLLGCWLAGRSGVSGQGSYPKPFISVSPGGVIPVGGNVTIRCRLQRPGMRILLYKDRDRNYLNYTDPAGSEAEFPITSARWEHGGSYTCRYHDESGIYSKYSDPVQIIVAVSRADGLSYTCYYPPDSDPDTWSELSDPMELVVPGLRGNSGPLWKGVKEPVPRAAGSDPPLRPCGEDGLQE
ncbi:leukocyte immunoglobulin-like receptor subfamily A member 2 [Macrochelys suwanniensis]